MERRFDALIPPSAVRPAQIPAPGKERISEPGDASEREAAALARLVAGNGLATHKDASPGIGAQAGRARNDFSGVRIHTDERAGAAARDGLHASAFTVGSHIAFAPGAYAPGTADGRRLLAHELAHVLQQGSVPGLDSQQVFRDAPDAGTSPDPLDAGTAPDPLDAGRADYRRLQLACVIRLGGCNIPGGIPTDEQIRQYNLQCWERYPGAPEVKRPTNEECRNTPIEPLSTGEKIFLGLLLVAGAAAALVILVAGAEVIVPIVIAGVESAGGAVTGAVAFYYANAIVVNEVGLFAAGLILSCEGDVPGLLRAIANDPAQAALILAEVYILHVNIQVANGPVRKATVPVKLLPPSEQTDPDNLRFRTIGNPIFEEAETTAAPPPPTQQAAAPAEVPPAPPAAAKKPPTPAATAPPKKAQPPLKGYYGGGAGIRKGMKTTPMAETEAAPPVRPGQPARARPATTLTPAEQTMVAEAEQASSRLGKPLQVKTKAAAGAGDVTRSGFGRRGGGAALTKQVLDVGKEIGHDFAQNPSLDGDIPGQSAASHAEKLAAVSNPGKALAVDRKICSDCAAFFQKYAQARNVTIVIHEPGQTWVFRPDGLQVGVSPGAQVVLRPGGASADPVSSGHQ